MSRASRSSSPACSSARRDGASRLAHHALRSPRGPPSTDSRVHCLAEKRAPAPCRRIACRSLPFRDAAGDCWNVSSHRKTVAHDCARCNIRVATPFDNHRTTIRQAMNRKEAKTRIAVLLSAGTRKADALAELSGQGLKDRVLAHLIASRPDPERCRNNKVHVRILIALGIAQLVISLMLAYYFFVSGAGNVLVTVFLALTVPLSLLFIWGFATHRVGAYHAFIVLSLLQIPKAVADLGRDPAAALPSLAITVVLVGYVWFVRTRLFPDYGWFTPRKVEGRYAFVERA
ncbi:hypothetical protein BCPG_05124 [Burkholderia cenocepacia PC184]|nr:hypothetical protein BCPG_05124 [Burkholderia cenocepacia PC184]